MGNYNTFDLIFIGFAMVLIVVIIIEYKLFKGVFLLCNSAILAYFNSILNVSDTLHMIIKSASYIMAIVAFLYLIIYRVPKNFGFWNGKQ